MKPDVFKDTLLTAMAGSHDSLEKILELYLPLINRHSYIDGKFDEDLKQYIMLHIALNTSKFRL